MIYHKTIKKMHTVVITDQKLMKWLLMGVSFELALCVLYSIFHWLEGGVEVHYNDELLYVEYACNQSRIVVWINQANYILGAALLVVFTYLAVRTRASSKVFKESNCAYFGSFFTLFTFGVVVVFNLITSDLEIIITIQAAAMAILLIVVWALFYGMFCLCVCLFFCFVSFFVWFVHNSSV